jgi:thiamine kinase-like enzyme
MENMAAPILDPEAQIRALPIWKSRIDIQPLPGGITNQNYVVKDGERRAVVRFGGDIPVHGVMRFNEQAASRAAGEAGVSPKVLYVAPNALVLDYIEGRTYGPDDVRADRARCLALMKRAHREIPHYVRGPILSFNVFHIIRDYAHTLADDQGRMAPQTPRFVATADCLQRAVGPIDLVFGHNDLLAANFIDDGTRLWLVDWDYAGWNTPLFDLGGLSSNNGFDAAENDAMLEDYFDAPATDLLRYRFQAMLCASLLRESLWSMAQESRSTIDFDYVGYTDENLRRFEAAWAAFREMEAK